MSWVLPFSWKIKHGRCLCLSAIPGFVLSSQIAIAGVDIAGEQEVLKILTNMVRREIYLNILQQPDFISPQVVTAATSSKYIYCRRSWL